MVATFGATYKLEGDNLKAAEQVAKEENFDLSNVKFRKGGVYQLFNNRDVTWNSNIVTNKDTDFKIIAHELKHYIQSLNKGWANFQAHGIYEQFLYSVLGIPVYEWEKYGDYYQESEAQYYSDHFILTTK